VYNSFKLKLSHTCTHTRSVAPHKHTHTYIWEYRATSNEQLERKNNIFVAFPRCVLGNQRSGETAAQPWGEVRLLVLKGGGAYRGEGAVRDRWGTLYLQLLTGKKIHGRTLCVQVQERKILARRQRSTNSQRFQGCGSSEISEQILEYTTL